MNIYVCERVLETKLAVASSLYKSIGIPLVPRVSSSTTPPADYPIGVRYSDRQDDDVHDDHARLQS